MIGVFWVSIPRPELQTAFSALRVEGGARTVAGICRSMPLWCRSAAVAGRHASLPAKLCRHLRRQRLMRLQVGTPALILIEIRQVVERGSYVRMVRAQGFFKDQQPPLIKRFSLGVTTLQTIKLR